MLSLSQVLYVVVQELHLRKEWPLNVLRVNHILGCSSTFSNCSFFELSPCAQQILPHIFQYFDGSHTMPVQAFEREGFLDLFVSGQPAVSSHVIAFVLLVAGVSNSRIFFDIFNQKFMQWQMFLLF